MANPGEAREQADGRYRFEAGGRALALAVPKDVYVPSDDTRLLGEAALKKCQGKVLEVGCGSGAVSILLAQAKGAACQITACDISPAAVETARQNAKSSGLPPGALAILQSDLFSALPASAKYDWIIFNPPYLPTAKLDKVSGPLNAALDGGADGLSVVRPFLEEAPGHLTAGGRVLLVVSSLQPQQKLQTTLRRQRLEGHLVSQESFFFEKLQVWQLEHKKE